MKISSYSRLIRELPELQQSFDIKKTIWKVPHQQHHINELFKKSILGPELIRVSRQDVFNASNDQLAFTLKTLMWGYPTKGRGKNVDKLLEKDNLEKLNNILIKYKNRDVTNSELISDSKQIAGLGLSTLTKFLYFLSIRIEGNPALILDQQIINVINSERFEELKPLKGIRYENALKRYSEYLHVMHNIAKDLQVSPGSLEYFLFTFGNQLSA